MVSTNPASSPDSEGVVPAAEDPAARAERKAARRQQKLRARHMHARLVMGALAIVRFTPRFLWNGVCAPLAARCAPGFLRRRAEAQLAMAFPDRYDAKQRRQIVRTMWKHQARAIRELTQYRRGDAKFVGRMVRPAPQFEERMRELQALGRGLVVVTPHFGNFELMPAWFKHFLGAHGAVVGKRNVNPWFDAEMVGMRARHGVETIYQDESPRKLLRILGTGGIVGILPDQDIVRLPGIFVDFFARPAWTTTGPAHLSMLAAAPLVPAFLTWQGDHYLLDIDTPIHPDRDAPRDEEIRRMTNAWTQVFERRISAHPEHWIWYHERWRTTPERAEKRRAEGRVRHTRAAP